MSIAGVGLSLVTGGLLLAAWSGPDPAPGESDLPPAADLVEDEQRLQGMMTYMAAAARFTECGSGSSFAIAQEGEYLALERAYLADRSSPGEPLLVTVRGRLTLRPGMDGGEVPSLVVAAFERTAPGAGCGEPVTDWPLEDTEWVLAELEGEVPPEGARATLLLDRGALRATGSGACNEFTGSYDLTGGRLTFGTMASTRRACFGPLMAFEGRYLQALGRVGGYRLVGAGLELLGEAGTAARFRAR
ncbi:MAG: META domain-containing protein [Longimicrobiales bacterium]|nr:META domain-containing protein [Longimicrobiales bacterium]